MNKEEQKAYFELSQTAGWALLKGHLENMMCRELRYAMTQEDVMANNKRIAQAEFAKSILTLVTSKAAEHLKVQKPFVSMPAVTILTDKS